MKRLFLIRHALPEIPNYDGLFPGPGLGTEGKIQSELISEFLTTKNIEVVFHSDYTRVIETMKPVLKKLSNSPIPQPTPSLREREASVESHESLVERTHSWLVNSLPEIMKNTTAIFSHCGPINMILEYFDPQKSILKYPFECPHLCHTPIAGIWELEFSNDLLISGILHFCKTNE